MGATPAPHAEILEVVKDILAEQGITLEIVQYNDYVQPNNAVEDGSLDANYFQHITYMNDFNDEYGTHLVSAAEVHYEPMGLYAGKTASLDELADGAQIGVPNDATNEARALLVLQQEGLITLTEGAGITATINDIVDNPKNLEIVEMEAAQLPLRLADLDMAVINGNYAIDAGLNMADALAVESADGEAAQAYVNVLAVKEGRENDPAIQALAAALCSDEVKAFIEENYNAPLWPSSNKPQARKRSPGPPSAGRGFPFAGRAGLGPLRMGSGTTSGAGAAPLPRGIFHGSGAPDRPG